MSKKPKDSILYTLAIEQCELVKAPIQKILKSNFELKKELNDMAIKIEENKRLKKQLKRTIQDGKVELALQNAHFRVASEEHDKFAQNNIKIINEAKEDLENERQLRDWTREDAEHKFELQCALFEDELSLCVDRKN